MASSNIFVNASIKKYLKGFGSDRLRKEKLKRKKARANHILMKRFPTSIITPKIDCHENG